MTPGRRGAERPRPEAVVSLGLLDGGRDPAFDRVARLAARAVRGALALVVFQDERRAELRGAASLVDSPPASWPVPAAAVRAVVEADEAVVLPAVDPHRPGDPAWTALGARAWAGVPLHSAPAVVEEIGRAHV